MRSPANDPLTPSDACEDACWISGYSAPRSERRRSRSHTRRSDPARAPGDPAAARQPRRLRRSADRPALGRPPSSGATALQVRVSQLRKALGDGGSLIVTRPPGYLIRLERDQLDLHRFEHLLGGADRDLGTDDPASAPQRVAGGARAVARSATRRLHVRAFAQAAIARLRSCAHGVRETLRGGSRAREARRSHRRAALVTESTPCGSGSARSSCSPSTARAPGRSAGRVPRRQTRAAGRARNRAGHRPPQLERAILRQEPALDLAERVPMRSILVAPSADEALEPLLALAESLARRPRRAARARASRDRRERSRVRARCCTSERVALLRGESARAPPRSRAPHLPSTSSASRRSKTSTCCSSTHPRPLDDPSCGTC